MHNRELSEDSESWRKKTANYWLAKAIMLEYVQHSSGDLPLPASHPAPDIVHEKVLAADLYPNGRLLSDAQIAMLRFYHSVPVDPLMRRDAVDYTASRLITLQETLQGIPANSPIFQEMDTLEQLEARREILRDTLRQAESSASVATAPFEKVAEEYIMHRALAADAWRFTKDYEKEKSKLELFKQEAEGNPAALARLARKEAALEVHFPAALRAEALKDYADHVVLRDRANRSRREYQKIINEANATIKAAKEELSGLAKESRQLNARIDEGLRDAGVMIEYAGPVLPVRAKGLARMGLREEVLLAGEKIFDLADSRPLHSGRNIKAVIKELPGLEQSSCSIIESNDRLYALYKGSKHADEGEDHSLGSGAFGKVKLCQDLETGEWYAYKVLKKATRQEGESEEKLLERGEQLKGGTVRHGSQNAQYEILMKLVPGVRLDDYVSSAVMTPEVCLTLLMGCCRSIQALHDNGIVHCDIKGDNLLYDGKTHEAGPIDFGLSKMIGESAPPSGSPAFMAPELLEAYRTGEAFIYTEKADVFSLGMAMAKSLGLTEDTPMAVLAQLEQIRGLDRSVTTGFHTVVSENSPEVSRSCIANLPSETRHLVIDLLKQMTHPDPLARITLKQAMEKIRLAELNESLQAIPEEKEVLSCSSTARFIKAGIQIHQGAANDSVYSSRETASIAEHSAASSGKTISPPLSGESVEYKPADNPANDSENRFKPGS